MRYIKFVLSRGLVEVGIFFDWVIYVFYVVLLIIFVFGERYRELGFF